MRIPFLFFLMLLNSFNVIKTNANKERNTDFNSNSNLDLFTDQENDIDINTNKNLNPNPEFTNFLNFHYDAEFIFDLHYKENYNFSIEVKIGEPKQTLNLLIDINSEFSFIKIPNCEEKNCLNENDLLEKSLFNYDPSVSKSLKLIEKNENFLFKNKEYKADIISDNLFFYSNDLKIKDKNFELKNFNFFLLKENLDIYADGILGLNPYIISNKYIPYNFIEHARLNNIINEKIFVLDLLNKNKAKLYLGQNNFKEFSMDTIKEYNNYNNNIDSINNNNNDYNNNSYLISNKNSYCKIKAISLSTNINILNNNKILNSNFNINSYQNQNKIQFNLTNHEDLSFIKKNSFKYNNNNNNNNNNKYNWICKSTHLIIGDDNENNFYNAISFENYLKEEKKRIIKANNNYYINNTNEKSNDYTDKENINLNLNINFILNENINIIFSSTLKNLIIEKKYLNLFIEKFSKNISKNFIVKTKGNMSYLIIKEKYFLENIKKIPSLNFLINGFSYKIYSEDLFEKFFSNSENSEIFFYRLNIEFILADNNIWQFGYIFLKNNIIEFNKEKNLVNFYQGIKKDMTKYISDEIEEFCFYNFFIYLFIFASIGYCMFYIYNRDKKKEINHLMIQNYKNDNSNNSIIISSNSNLNNTNNNNISKSIMLGYDKHYSLRIKEDQISFLKKSNNTSSKKIENIMNDPKMSEILLEKEYFGNINSNSKELSYFNNNNDTMSIANISIKTFDKDNNINKINNDNNSNSNSNFKIFKKKNENNDYMKNRQVSFNN
jgi:hypothetical protein